MDCFYRRLYLARLLIFRIVFFYLQHWRYHKSYNGASTGSGSPFIVQIGNGPFLIGGRDGAPKHAPASASGRPTTIGGRYAQVASPMAPHTTHGGWHVDRSNITNFGSSLVGQTHDHCQRAVDTD